MTMDLCETSMILARKMFTICMISLLFSRSTLTFITASSLSRDSDGSISLTRMTLINLLSCFMTCSRTSLSPCTVMVMREYSGLSVAPTERLSMLKDLRLKRPAMRVSTPDLFSTMTAILCFI